MMKPILTTALLVGLTACSSCTADQQAKALHYVSLACEVDGKYQPIAVSVLNAAGVAVPQLTNVAALDQAVVHPAVVAFCASVGGAPVAVVK